MKTIKAVVPRGGARRMQVLILSIFIVSILPLNSYADNARALIDAAKNGDAVSVKALLYKGADVKAADGFGATPLNIAVQHGHTEVVMLLLSAQARFNKQGKIVCQLKTPYRDGTPHLIFTPLELLQRLTALIPRPRINLIRYHGILAPNAKDRGQVIPKNQNKTPTQEPQAQSSYRPSWAKLLKRVFAIDVSHCPACGGAMKIVAAITDPGVIHKILTHLGLSPQPPPRAQARYSTGQDDLL